MFPKKIKVECRLEQWKETEFYFNQHENGVITSAYCDGSYHPCPECDKCREVAEKKFIREISGKDKSRP